MEPKLLNLPFQLRVVRLQGRALGLEPLYLSRQLSIEWMVFRPFSGDGLDVLFVPLQGPFAVPRVHETLPMGLRPPGRGWSWSATRGPSASQGSGQWMVFRVLSARDGSWLPFSSRTHRLRVCKRASTSFCPLRTRVLCFHPSVSRQSLSRHCRR